VVRITGGREINVRILIIEDDAEVRRALAERLIAEGVRTTYQTSDLAGALGLISYTDGILSDDAFPIIAGDPPSELAWKVARYAAQVLAKPFALIVSDTDTWLEALQEGAHAYERVDSAHAVAYLLRVVRENPVAA
jgi:CheY-like chemotaxis protein